MTDTTARAPMPEPPAKPKRDPASVVSGLIVYALAVVSLGLSGWSLYGLLRSVGAPAPVAVLGVGVFDGVALVAALQVYARRMEPHKALGARLVMMGALFASAIVNGAHGMQLGGWMTAFVLAAAPLAFEVGFELRHRTLTGLVWVLFRKHTMQALKRDAWERIAPPAVTGTDAHSVERADSPAPTAVPAPLPASTPAAPALPAGTSPEATTELLRVLLSLAGQNGTSPVPAPLQVPQDHGTKAAPVEVEEAPEAGTPAGTEGDPEGQVPQVDKSAVRSAGTPRNHLRPVRGAATAQIRNLIGQGVTEVPEIRDRLADSGVKVPDPSYIRRLVREAREGGTEGGTANGTGNYM